MEQKLLKNFSVLLITFALNMMASLSLDAVTINLPYPSGLAPQDTTLDISSLDMIGGSSFEQIFKTNKKTSIIVGMVLTKKNNVLMASPYEIKFLINYFSTLTWGARPILPHITAENLQSNYIDPSDRTVTSNLGRWGMPVNKHPIENIIFFKITRSGLPGSFSYKATYLNDLLTLLKDDTKLAEFEVDYLTTTVRALDLEEKIKEHIVKYTNDGKQNVADLIAKKYSGYQQKNGVALQYPLEIDLPFQGAGKINYNMFYPFELEQALEVSFTELFDIYKTSSIVIAGIVTHNDQGELTISYMYAPTLLDVFMGLLKHTPGHVTLKNLVTGINNETILINPLNNKKIHSVALFEIQRVGSKPNYSYQVKPGVLLENVINQPEEHIPLLTKIMTSTSVLKPIDIVELIEANILTASKNNNELRGALNQKIKILKKQNNELSKKILQRLSQVQKKQLPKIPVALNKLAKALKSLSR